MINPKKFIFLITLVLIFFVIISACTSSTGETGRRGATGATGYTPILGKDYFNASCEGSCINGTSSTIDVNYTFTGDEGTSASVINIGDLTNALLDFTIPKGDKGDKGDTGEGINGTSSTIDVNYTFTGDEGTSASVINIGDLTNALLDFTIPRGFTGYNGTNGTSSTIDVNYTFTGDNGTPAIVTNIGNSTNALLDFTIPRGFNGTNGLKFGSQYVTGTRSLTKVPISYTTVGTTYWTCPSGVTSIDYLIVGGGGSGGGTTGWVDIGLAGGGAGGVLSGTMAVTPLTTYTIVVGAGGTGVQSAGNNGANSSFDTLIAIGGGRGDGYNGTWGNGFGGGSGGGAGYNHLVGQPVSGQGYAGGVGGGAGSYPAGGGGGAGSVGGAASTTIAGNGGTGISSTITGSTVWYAGGGGGGKSTAYGAGGSGGSSIGGTGGGNNIYPTAGTVNTGSGGGGASGGNNGYWTGGNGGSGIVIISYATENSQNVNTIAHGLGYTPSFASITLSNITEMGAVTAMNETTITIAITKPSGFGGTNQTVYWMVA